MILQNGRKEGELLRTGQYIYIYILKYLQKNCVYVYVYIKSKVLKQIMYYTNLQLLQAFSGILAPRTKLAQVE